ncbi:MAG: NUDIX hydrolase [Thermaerobacter sp.]|nr:NUDIX hydrolase [Thermaerobacter sp.]
MLTFEVPGGVFNYRIVGVLIRGGDVLVHRTPEEDFWSLPGGRCEFGEASASTLVREFIEELGAEVRVGRLLWVVENFFDKLGPAYHEIAFYYEVTTDAALPREEVFRGRVEDRDPPLIFRWVPLDAVGDLRLYPTFLREGLRDLPQEITHVVHWEVAE